MMMLFKMTAYDDNDDDDDDNDDVDCGGDIMSPAHDTSYSQAYDQKEVSVSSRMC